MSNNMIEYELRKRRCCFTGHRPEKLGISELKAKALLRTAIEQAVTDGFVTFISGMARGVDVWAAEIVLEIRKENSGIHLICASPYEGFEKRWSYTEQKRYGDILSQADLVRFVCNHYSRSCFQIRNEWMIDHSAMVIAAFNGKSGGTKNTISYAKRNGVYVYNVLNI